ncbi:MAG: hypothetical protein JEZ11_13195 [Desulfobacterales bacterium]|nr:hypothetical protein [Desulfobacterales bacterium]
MGDKLIIFDFSGTLSLEAARFGRPENLARSLEQSGLADMGIDEATYWQRIIAPTWKEASTTARGLSAVMVQQVRTLAPKGVSLATVEAAVARFVAAYLQASIVSPRWAPTLAAVNAQPAAVAVVATDHYPEATTAILGHLSSLGLSALPLKSARTVNLRRSFLIANSADIGYHKASPLFWRELRTRLSLITPEEILLIDDFGANETDRTGYATADAVCHRKEKTEAVLGQAFSAPVTVLPFVVETTGEGKEVYGQRIQEVYRIVFDFLATP